MRLSVLGAALLSLCVMGAGILMWASGFGVQASTRVTYGQTLFFRDGTHNQNLAYELTQLAERARPWARNQNVGGESHLGARADGIRAANHNTLPVIRMFEQTANASLQNVTQSFTMQQWRLVYITFSDDQTAEPVFTFMMTNPYRNIAFNSIGFYGTTMHTDYNNATIRDTINQDFETVLYDFPNARSSIVMPRDLPGTWQSRNHGGRRHAMDNRLDDLIWLPSSFEIGEDGNLWHIDPVNRAVLAGQTNGFNYGSWLRSADMGNNNNARMLRSNGTPCDGGRVWNNRSVRPAIHISLGTLVNETLETYSEVVQYINDTYIDTFEVTWDDELELRFQANIGYRITSISIQAGDQELYITTNQMDGEFRAFGNHATWRAWYQDDSMQEVVLELTEISTDLLIPASADAEPWTQERGYISWNLNGGVWASGLVPFPPVYFDDIYDIELPPAYYLQYRPGYIFNGWQVIRVNDDYFIFSASWTRVYIYPESTTPIGVWFFVGGLSAFILLLVGLSIIRAKCCIKV